MDICLGLHEEADEDLRFVPSAVFSCYRMVLNHANSLGLPSIAHCQTPILLKALGNTQISGFSANSTDAHVLIHILSETGDNETLNSWNFSINYLI